MKKTFYRGLAFSLCIVLLLLSMPSFAAAALRYENSGTEFMDETDAGISLYNQEKNALPKLPGNIVPPQYKSMQSTKLYINYRLWKDEGVLCYGNYKSMPGNDFRAGMQQPGQPEKHGVNDGYYSNPYGGSRGEWRYHGYDVSGNKLTNIYFIPDSVVTKFDERNWVKDPWLNLPSDKRITASVYNDAAIRDRYDNTVKSGVQTWINKSMAQYNGVPLLGSTVDPEVFRYLNVESAPTTLRMGQGRMWHKRPDNSIWYQTVVVPTLEPKKDLPVAATITPLTPISVKDAGPAMDNKPVTLQFKVSAVLDDTAVINDAVKKTVYYTREDIKSWEFTFTPPVDVGTAKTESNVKKVENTGSSIFSLTTTYGKLRNRTLHLTATGQPLYNNEDSGIKDNASLDYTISMTPMPQPPPPVGEPPAVIDIPTIKIQNQIGEIAFDGVLFTEATDNTDMSMVTSTELYVNGQAVDYNTFFSGQYIFPATTSINGYMAEVICKYNLDESKIVLDGLTEQQKATIMSNVPVQYVSTDYAYVYPTKPIANFKISSNTWKQNRLISVKNTSNEGNIQLVIQKYPIVQYEWTYGGDTTQLRKGTDTDLTKELLYKKPGIYSLTLKVKNTLGKWSDPYTVDYQVLEDVAPAVGVNLAESVYTRNDKVSAWYYCAASTDGDIIKSSSIELWYDSNNDGTLDQKLSTWSNQVQFPDYTPTKLGYYKYKLSAQEDIASDTLMQHITEADKKSASYEVEFWVDNYRPLSDIYVNIPIQRPNIDVYFMLDKNLDPAKKDYMLNNRVNMANWLLGKNIIPNVNIWDMRTYTYTQPASTSINTGGSYPSFSTYYSSNGYSGTLSLSSVSNNSYSVDQGGQVTKTESKTVTLYGSQSGDYAFKDYPNGVAPTYPTSGSKSYSDADGYSGSLSTSYTYSGYAYPAPSYTNYHFQRNWTWSGTVYKTVTVWQPNIVWHNNYTGYYSGTIYKNVRQPYTDTFNPTAQKYVVYISDSTVSELSDLNMVMGYAKTAKLFLAGTSGIKTQRTYDQYFDVTGKSIDIIANDMLQKIAESSPAVEKYYVLQDQTFAMNTGQIDLESDPVVEQEMQYVQDLTYYDNPTGMEPEAVSVYSDTSWWKQTRYITQTETTNTYTYYQFVSKSWQIFASTTYSPKTSTPYSDPDGYSGTLYLKSTKCIYDSGAPSPKYKGSTYNRTKTYENIYGGTVSNSKYIKNVFHNVGKYTIYRRVKDKPSIDPNFANFSYYSGSTALEVYVVRKPIALAALDWDYDTATSTYKTSWVDQSYDPDHQYNRPDKGIVDRNIMWRKSGGQWNYGIPNNLTSGTYELNYYVLDPEGYWSDPFVMNFNLDPAPTMQFASELRSLNSSFGLDSLVQGHDLTGKTIPASEYLEAFNLWTRYPYNVRLDMAIYSDAASTTPLTPVKSVYYSAATGIKAGNDIYWNNVIYQIPATLPDRAYNFRITAVGDYGRTATKSFTLNVTTPVDLVPSLPAELTGGTSVQADAQTSMYVNTVEVNLFHGTAYERTYRLSKVFNAKSSIWTGSLSIPGGIPDGYYTARFTAFTPNGRSQTRDESFKLVNLSITNVSINGYWNHWRGQVDILGERLTNEPHRFLSLECVKIDITTFGNPERVAVRFSPELEAMSYTDPNGHTYDYNDDYFGYDVVFPADSTFPATGNHIYWEYHLPLAPSTKGWNNSRVRQPYKMTVTAFKGQTTAQYVINDIDITGNIYDLTYIQPKE